MNDEPVRGTLEHCLAQGATAARLLKRFQEVVSAEEMSLVRYWFEELHRKAALHLRQGHELVSVGFENREAWDAGPFMVFNPTEWIGSRRKLLAPTATGNPRQWVRIQIRSLSMPRNVATSVDPSLWCVPSAQAPRLAPSGLSVPAPRFEHALEPAPADWLAAPG